MNTDKAKGRWLGEIAGVLLFIAAALAILAAWVVVLVLFAGCAATPKSKVQRIEPTKTVPDLAKLMPPVIDAPTRSLTFVNAVAPAPTTNVVVSWAWAFAVATNPLPRYFVQGSTNAGKSWTALTNSTGTNATLGLFSSAVWLRVMGSNAAQAVTASNRISLAASVGNGLSWKIYWGGASRVYTNSTPLTAATQTMQVVLGSGNYFLAATAVNSNGVESDFSAETRWPTNWLVTNIKKGGS